MERSNGNRDALSVVPTPPGAPDISEHTRAGASHPAELRKDNGETTLGQPPHLPTIACRADDELGQSRLSTAILFVKAGIEQVRNRAAVLYWNGPVPEAVAGHAAMIRSGFQRKAMTLLLHQAIVALVLATAVNYADAANPAPRPIFIALCITTLVVTKVASVIRFGFPTNYITVAVLTMASGAMFGLMTRPTQDVYAWLFEDDPGLRELQIVFLGAYTLAVSISWLLVSICSRRHTLRVSTVSGIAVFIVSIALVILWANTKFCTLGWLCGTIAILLAIVGWLGFDMDRLLTKLKVDEYFLPAILVWGDIIFFLLIGGVALCIYGLIFSETDSDLGVGDNSCDLECCHFSCADCFFFEDPPDVEADAPAPAQDAPPGQVAVMPPPATRKAW